MSSAVKSRIGVLGAHDVGGLVLPGDEALALDTRDKSYSHWEQQVHTCRVVLDWLPPHGVLNLF
jgi:hypothetical protein